MNVATRPDGFVSPTLAGGTFALRQGLTAAGRYARFLTDGTRVCLGGPLPRPALRLELALSALRAVEGELGRLIEVVAAEMGLPAFLVVRKPVCTALGTAVDMSKSDVSGNEPGAAQEPYMRRIYLSEAGRPGGAHRGLAAIRPQQVSGV
jgi:hypothetical protein